MCHRCPHMNGTALAAPGVPTCLWEITCAFQPIYERKCAIVWSLVLDCGFPNCFHSCRRVHARHGEDRPLVQVGVIVDIRNTDHIAKQLTHYVRLLSVEEAQSKVSPWTTYVVGLKVHGLTKVHRVVHPDSMLISSHSSFISCISALNKSLTPEQEPVATSMRLRTAFCWFAADAATHSVKPNRKSHITNYRPEYHLHGSWLFDRHDPCPPYRLSIASRTPPPPCARPSTPCPAQHRTCLQTT